MTDIEALVARLIQRGGIELPNFPAPYPESLMLEAAAALREQAGEIDGLKHEIYTLRLYGNKECTHMADAAMASP